MSADDLTTRLARLDTCVVSDALDALGIAGAVLGISSLTVAKRIAGRVVTVALGPAGSTKPARHLGTAAVMAGGPGDIILVAHNQRLDVAGWGGLLSLAAASRGVAGIVIDGACRDVDEAFDLELPVYARAGVPVTARGRIIETAWNERVQFAGVQVDPGAYLLADRSGIVLIATDRAAEVIVLAERLSRKEALMAAAITEGHPITEVMSRDYETMLDTPGTADVA